MMRFPATAFGFARRQYDSLLQTGIAFEHDWCGVNQIAYDEKSVRKITQILHGNWPTAVVTPLSADEMDATAGVAIGFSGVSYAESGWLCPAELTTHALTYAHSLGLVVHFATRVSALENITSGWQLRLENGQQKAHPVVILANGHRLGDWPQTQHLPCYAVRSQVIHIPRRCCKACNACFVTMAI